jgi:hypothetical protein
LKSFYTRGVIEKDYIAEISAMYLKSKAKMRHLASIQLGPGMADNERNREWQSLRILSVDTKDEGVQEAVADVELSHEEGIDRIVDWQQREIE